MIKFIEIYLKKKKILVWVVLFKSVVYVSWEEI